METFSQQPSESPRKLSYDSPSEQTLETFNDTVFEYKILKGHFEPDRETWTSDEKLRLEYLELTDRLVQKMLEEKEVINPETKEVELRRPSTVIFLDKSARPLSHLVRAMWPTFAKDPKTGEVAPMPRFNFLNIDREQWTNTTNEKGLGHVDVDQINPDIIRSLRATSLTSAGKEQVISQGITNAVDAMPTSLDNESILVVDETRSTGNTLRIATGILQRAFPTAHIEGTHWMAKTYRLKDGTELNGIPNWYSETEVRGRGVGDRYANYARYQKLNELSHENYYRAVGSLFLSAPLQEKDEDYRQLIREFKELAASPDVPIMPSLSQYEDESEFDDRVIAYNYKDIDLASLSDKEKQELCDTIFAKVRQINADSEEEGARMKVRNRPQKRRR
jgi:hypothetical protein